MSTQAHESPPLPKPQRWASPLNPNGPCDFGVCAPVGSGFSVGTTALGELTKIGSVAETLSRIAGVAGLLFQTIYMTGDGRPFDPNNPAANLPESVAKLLRNCTTGALVTEPATGGDYPGGTSYEQEYICSTGIWTIHWIMVGGQLKHGPHIRPGSPTGGGGN